MLCENYLFFSAVKFYFIDDGKATLNYEHLVIWQVYSFKVLIILIQKPLQHIWSTLLSQITLCIQATLLKWWGPWDKGHDV